MTDREQSATRPFRFGVLAFVVLTLLVITAFAFLLLRPRTPTRASIELDRKLAQLRKDGVPLTTADLGRSLPDPDAEHDARLVLSAAFAWRPGAPATTNLPIVSRGTSAKRDEPIRSHVMSELATYLTNSDALLAAIPAQLKGVWFSMGWSNGVASAPPTHFFQIRQLTQTLALKSLFEAEQQNSRTAVDALSAGFNVAGTLNTDSLASTMMRVAILGMMCEASEQVLNRTKATDVQLLSLQQSIHPARSDDFAYAFTTERCLATTMFDSLRAAHDGGGSELLFLMRLARWMSGDRKPIYRDEDYLAYLNFLDEHRAAQSLPGFERLGRSKQLNALLKTNTYSTMLEIIAPNWTRAMHAAIEAGARLEAAKAALAVERYRLAHNGELPDSWSALVPMYLTAAPRDPLDHQPLRFKKLSRGYIVYSIGADGVDNGGGERANHTVTNHYDVTFTVER